MKICLISFDFWNYDHHIVQALQQKGIDAHHINLRGYEHQYPTFFHRIGNFFTKLLLNRNVKKIHRDNYILKELAALGQQDQILVINPEIIPLHIHRKIKPCTNRYIAYLYDSSLRHPVSHLLDAHIFDTVLSFDLEDVKTYNLKPLTNYIYFEKGNAVNVQNEQYHCFTISSIDERLDTLNKVSEIFRQQNLSSQFIVVGKRKPPDLHPDIIFLEERLDQEAVHQKIKNSKTVLDLLRKDQTGISFRIFEALGFQKKIITTNVHIKNYDFYFPENILIIDAENPQIPESFFSTPYKELPEEIYRKYTLSSWVEEVFELS
ncbi:MAG TPA: hypothetical protein VKX40_01145 [Aequorivita sp.]|nr:hypothetical protein [Aequorivita sp.]